MPIPKLNEEQLSSLNSDERAELLVALFDLARCEAKRKAEETAPPIKAHSSIILGAARNVLEEHIRTSLNSAFHKNFGKRTWSEFFKSKGCSTRSIRRPSGSPKEKLSAEQQAMRIVENLRSKLGQ